LNYLFFQYYFSHLETHSLDYWTTVRHGGFADLQKETTIVTLFSPAADAGGGVISEKESFIPGG